MNAQTKESQAALSINEALEILKDGNQRFLSNQKKEQRPFKAGITNGWWPVPPLLQC